MKQREYTKSTLQEEAADLDSQTPSDAKAKKRKQQQNFRKKVVRKELSFQPQEWKLVVSHAQKHGKRTGTHLRELALAQIQCVHVLGDVERKLLQEFNYQTYKIGNNLNQVARICNKEGKVEHLNLKYAHDVLGWLRTSLETHLTHHPELFDHITTAVTENPDLTPQIRTLLDSLTTPPHDH